MVALIGKRGEDAEPVQLFRNLGGTGTVQPHTEDILYHAGGIGVGDKLVFVFLGFDIPVDGERAHKVSVAAFYVQRRPCLDGDVTAVRFVHNILDADREIVAAVLFGGVDVVRDGDEADAVGGKHAAQIASGFDVLASEAGKVLNDHAVDRAVRDLLHHFLECGSIEKNSAIPVVDLLCDKLDIGVVCREVFNELALVAYAVALAAPVVRVGKPDIRRRLIFRHKKVSFRSGQSAAKRVESL